MTDTPNLVLPYILAAQSQKHVTHNEAIRALDALVQLSVIDRNLATPPATPADGARYLVAASATGAWAGQTGRIAAFQDGAWAFYAPKDGWMCWVADENAALVFDNNAWIALTAGGGGGGVTDHGALTGLADDDHPQYLNNARGDARYTPLAPTTLGVNATADTTNRLAVGSAASLFNHAGSGGHQVKVNKAAATDTASFLFQTGFSGRAEFGTTGDDDFHFKVSANGSTWTEALVVDKASGRVVMPETDCDVQTFATAGAYTWTKPGWATPNSVVEVFLVGAGGGGGSGRMGAAATVRCGGGGGGAGTFSTFKFRASDLAATVNGSVGAGGNGGASQTSNASNGIAGAAGGTTTFGSVRAVGGNAGAGGSATAGAGGAASGALTAFTQGGAAGGAASTSGAAGAVGAAGVSISGGGGAGAGLTAANAQAAGGAGGTTSSWVLSTSAASGGTAGTAGGGTGGNGNAYNYLYGQQLGSGGGGGGSSATLAGGDGGNGGRGAGGGGGAGAVDGTSSGNGGNGGDGWCVIVTYK